MSKLAMCTKCGSNQVFWHQNRNGKWVLCVRAQRAYDNGVGAWIQPHICTGEGLSTNEMIEQVDNVVSHVFNMTLNDWQNWSINVNERVEDVIAGELAKFKSLRKALNDDAPSYIVEVFKGRKVPVGTIGELIWFNLDSYGSMKVGIKDAEGNAHFTAITNVRLTEKAGA